MRCSRFGVGLALFTAFLMLSTAGSAEAQRRRRRDREPTPTAPSGPATILLIGEAPGAEVLIDEAVVGTLPLDGPLTVEPGTHTLRIRRAGYTEYTEVITLAAAESYDVFVDLMALSQVLEVETNPEGAHVFVDKIFLGDTPTELELLDGTHRLRVSLPGFEEVSRELTAVAGAHEHLSFELVAIPLDDGEQWYESPITWIAVGGGLVAVALIVVVIAVVAGQSGGTQSGRFCEGLMNPCINVVPF